jgi:hypothetical protein
MSLHNTALNMCQLALASTKEQLGRPFTREDIAASVDQILSMSMFADVVDREALIEELEQIFTVWSNDPTAIGNDTDHVPWLTQRRADIDWRFWNRYRLFLINRQHLPPAAIETIEKVSDEVLGRIEDPPRDGSWDRRGLVMGNVQSGKTATYIGLICKAADAGYKVIIVLAGLHNNLRSQTQMRLDEGFLGYKAAPPSNEGATFEPTGVAEYGTNTKADSVTNRNENGDFNRHIAKHFGIHPGGYPLLFVVKKNATVLRNLLGWIHASADSTEPETGRKFHRNIPLLVIDDEADQASVDTREGAVDENGERDEDHDPTKINRLIRSLLFSFAKCAYVGFTATPFANIYIHEHGRTRDLGDDLFPRSFIINLPGASNYTGAARIFGIIEDEDAGLEAVSALPIVRFVDDHASSDKPDETEGWVPPNLVEKTGHVPLYSGQRMVPPSLRKALLCFLLTTTVRQLRETGPMFNSMLIHVVRYTNVQAVVKEEVERELSDVVHRLQYGDGSRRPTLLQEIQTLWNEDYVITSAALGEGFTLPSWSEVEMALPKLAATIKVRSINGSALDALDYEQHRDTGLNIVAVGGDKLSRGLTLEGLTVSYFLRGSRMYDTLMQMGRWFGYKGKYLDVCRLFTTKEMYAWFQHIAAATEELRIEFDHMVSVGATPKDYGLKVRSHPLMLVTSAVKMRSGTELSLSYSGDISETIIFDTTVPRVQKNLDAANWLLRKLGSPEPDGGRSGGYLWPGVRAAWILDFLERYETHPEARRADTRLLSRYIRRQTEQDELTTWSVLLASSGLATAQDLRSRFDGRDVGSIHRDYHGEIIEKRYTVRRLVSPNDEASDLDPTQRDRALERTIEDWRNSKRKKKSLEPPTAPSGKGSRSSRPKDRGLLLLYPLDGSTARTAEAVPVVGLAISFPESDTAKAISYRVNNVFTAAGDYDEL